MKPSELWSRLHVGEVDHNELASIIQAHFGSATSEHDLQITYQHHNDQRPALILRYDDGGALLTIEGGPGLADTDLPALEQKVIRDLLASPGDRIRRGPLFAGSPVTGTFRYRDKFQLLPVPPEAPRPPFRMADHPFLLEYRYRTSTDPHVSNRRAGQEHRTIELLCVALLSRFRGSINYTANRWVITDPLAGVSRYHQEGYGWLQAYALSEEFSRFDLMEVMPTVPSEHYYARRAIGPDQVFDLPDNFGALLDAFFARPPAARERVLRAAHWFQNAQRIYIHSQSASFVALATAIETLLPREPSGPACTACGRPTGGSITKRFTEFVEKYAPSPTVSREQRKELYWLRSALSHGGKLLHSDHVGPMLSFTPAHVKQFDDMSAMWIVNTVIANWLSDPKAA